MTFDFLSDDWVAQARKIRSEHGANSQRIVEVVRVNLVVTEVPFGAGEVQAHLDTSSGELDLDSGHIDDPHLTVTIDYYTAKSMLVEGNPQAGMQGFMAGKVRVDGDIAKLMALQGGALDSSTK